MTYKNYEIMAEVITERAEYTLDDDGNIADWYNNIDSEPEISTYGIYDPKNGEYVDWVDTLEEAKGVIDRHYS